MHTHRHITTSQFLQVWSPGQLETASVTKLKVSCHQGCPLHGRLGLHAPWLWGQGQLLPAGKGCLQQLAKRPPQATHSIAPRSAGAQVIPWTSSSATSQIRRSIFRGLGQAHPGPPLLYHVMTHSQWSDSPIALTIPSEPKKGAGWQPRKGHRHHLGICLPHWVLGFLILWFSIAFP
jgi:hypothetical protein